MRGAQVFYGVFSGLALSLPGQVSGVVAGSIPLMSFGSGERVSVVSQFLLRRLLRLLAGSYGEVG